jgi:hypothetical protein
MNIGIRAAKGKHIAIMGAHNRYADDYLLRAVEALEATGADNVGGAMECWAQGRVQRAVAAVFHHPLSVGGARWHDPTYEGLADTVFGGVYRREVFDRIGMFDEELVRNQDDELNLRLVRAGGRIWQAPSVRSWYRPRDSLEALFRQYQQYGYWKVRVIQKHRRPASLRHLVPALFVTGIGASIVLLVVSALVFALGYTTVSGVMAWGAALSLALILVPYAAVISAASVQIAKRDGWDLLPLLPVVYLCYHIGYGLGFVEGLVHFMIVGKATNPSRGVITRGS